MRFFGETMTLVKVNNSRDSERALNVSARVADVEHLPFDDEQFDCVVDTFGLCSVADPHAPMSEMSRVCKSGGLVLLLEHGASSWHNIVDDCRKGLERYTFRLLSLPCQSVTERDRGAPLVRLVKKKKTNERECNNEAKEAKSLGCGR
jgi:ubiquinone/menaquinone biosynthesis C-methylase UbiE